MVFGVRREGCDVEGEVRVEDSQGVVRAHSLAKESCLSLGLEGGARVLCRGTTRVHGVVRHSFGSDKVAPLNLRMRARQFSCFMCVLGNITGAGELSPTYAMLVQNKDELFIPLLVEPIPSAGEFKANTVSISPEQQTFAKHYRAMQLSSTLFGICIIQIKPQLERVLRLLPGGLTKEIRLTQKLMEFFLRHQLPPDVLAFGGPDGREGEPRVREVKRQVRRLELMLQRARLTQEREALDQAEEKAVQQQAEGDRQQQRRILEREEMSMMLEGGQDEDRGEGRRGGRRGKVAAAREKLTVKEEEKESVADEEKEKEPMIEECEEEECEEVMENMPCMLDDMEEEEEEKDAMSEVMNEVMAPTMVSDFKKKSRKEKSGGRRRIRLDMDMDEGMDGDMAEVSAEVERKPRELSAQERIRREFGERRAALEARRAELAAEDAELEAMASQTAEGRGVPTQVLEEQQGAAVWDVTGIPGALDTGLERLDPEGSVRPTILRVGPLWRRTRTEGLLGEPLSLDMAVEQQKEARSEALHLLDALTHSGGLELHDVHLHVLVAVTHFFDKTLMQTLVCDNVNPIDRVQHTQLIVARHISALAPDALLVPLEAARIQTASPQLYS